MKDNAPSEFRKDRPVQYIPNKSTKQIQMSKSVYIPPLIPKTRRENQRQGIAMVCNDSDCPHRTTKRKRLHASSSISFKAPRLHR